MAVPGGAAGAGSGAAAAAAIANAIKASGAIVRVEPEDFLRILGRVEKPVVVVASSTFLNTRFKYLTSYKGLAFFTKTSRELHLPGSAEVILAKKIWIPG